MLASLSASAAAVAATSDAQAQIITTSVNVTVGFGGGDLSSYTFSGLPGASFTFNRNLNQVIFPSYVLTTGRNVRAGLGSRGTLRNSNIYGVIPYLNRVAAGLTFSQIGVGSVNNAPLIGNAQSPTRFKGDNDTQIYTAFRFKDSNRGDAFSYGYMTGTFSSTDQGSMGYHIDSITYEASGVKIETGQTTLAAAVPEPSQLALGAMAALAGGAFAVRRWKADRAATAAGTAARA